MGQRDAETLGRSGSSRLSAGLRSDGPAGGIRMKPRRLRRRSRSVHSCSLLSRRSLRLRCGCAGSKGQLGCQLAQRRSPCLPNTAYDGRFKFARLKFTTGPGGYYYEGLPAWAHGYPEGRAQPDADSQRAQPMSEPHLNETNVLALDDPELCKYPVAYMFEAAFLTMTDREAVAFREYLQKGGFVIFDDFREYFRRDADGGTSRRRCAG